MPRPSPFPAAIDNAVKPAPALGRAAPGAAGLAAPAFDPLATALPLTDASTRDRLQALRQRVRGPWTPATSIPVGASESINDAAGQRLGLLWMLADQIVWLAVDGRVWRATLAGASGTP